jgi:hypothetical protein
MEEREAIASGFLQERDLSAGSVERSLSAGSVERSMTATDCEETMDVGFQSYYSDKVPSPKKAKAEE